VTSNSNGQKVKMSSTVLKIISTIPTYVPNKSERENAEIFLEKMYDKTDIELQSSETVEFVDQGENFDSVSCNLCGHKFEMEVWQTLVDKAHDQKFSELRFVTPCCNKNTSLNDLIYVSPAGFAKFTITIADPKSEMDQKSTTELERILNTKVKSFWAHY